MMLFCGNGHELRKPSEANCPYCYCETLETRIQELEAALERIYALTHAFDDQNKFAEVLSGIAKEALQRAGGGECAPRYPWHPTEDDYRAGK